MTLSKAILRWPPEMEEPFEKLENAMTSPTVLPLSAFERRTVMETNASSVSTGAVLSQKREDKRIRPVRFAGQMIFSAQPNYLACEQQALALVCASG